MTEFFVDLSLSKRLESAEGGMGARFAETRGRLFSDYDGSWMSEGGVIAIYDGIDSPLTQTFGLGLCEPPDDKLLERLERFYFERNSFVHHEISPYAGVDLLELLCLRGYHPVELSNVYFRSLDPSIDYQQENFPDTEIVIAKTPVMYQQWTQVNMNAWSHEYPELGEFISIVGRVNEANDRTECFFATCKYTPASAGAVTIIDGVAVLNGAATLPQFRGHGLQSALIQARLNYAAKNDCKIAVITVAVGSNSQRNAERNGFKLAYSRSKWKLTK